MAAAASARGGPARRAPAPLASTSGRGCPMLRPAASSARLASGRLQPLDVCTQGRVPGADGGRSARLSRNRLQAAAEPGELHPAQFCVVAGPEGQGAALLWLLVVLYIRLG